MVPARELRAGDVTRCAWLTVAAAARVAGNTAVVQTVEGVTVYLRAAGAAPPVKPRPEP